MATLFWGLRNGGIPSCTCHHSRQASQPKLFLTHNSQDTMRGRLYALERFFRRNRQAAAPQVTTNDNGPGIKLRFTCGGRLLAYAEGKESSHSLLIIRLNHIPPPYIKDRRSGNYVGQTEWIEDEV